METFEYLEHRDLVEFPYEVWHPEGRELTGSAPPKFSTWPEALDKQKEWNREYPGHIARKRRVAS